MCYINTHASGPDHAVWWAALITWNHWIISKGWICDNPHLETSDLWKLSTLSADEKMLPTEYTFFYTIHLASLLMIIFNTILCSGGRILYITFIRIHKYEQELPNKLNVVPSSYPIRTLDSWHIVSGDTRENKTGIWSPDSGWILQAIQGKSKVPQGVSWACRTVTMADMAKILVSEKRAYFQVSFVISDKA